DRRRPSCCRDLARCGACFGGCVVSRVALRGIRAHLVQFVLSLLAVTLGVAFVAGTFSLRTMMSSTFTGIVDSSALGQAYVRGSEPIASAQGGTLLGE